MGMRVPATGLAAVLSLYLALALAYSRLQRRFADPRPLFRLEPATKYRPASVDVIVPCYNEEPALLAACLRSLRSQDYRGELAVWVVDDGSGNRAELLPVLEGEADRAWRVVLLDGNRGKREAQAAALREGRGELVVTIDSDTSIAPDGIRRIVAPLADPRVGAVTGDLRPSNPEASWLTQLIVVRYRLLFGLERAAQSAFGAVLCCAGPFSVYRRSAVEQVWPQYIGQRFWGMLRISGDDLKLTNLVLAAGYRSVYEPTARAATNVPATLRQYFRQQLRWHRSFYRELPQMLRLLPGRGGYLAVDLGARTLLPALAAAGLAMAAVDAVLAPARLPADVGALALMAIASINLIPSPAKAAGRRFAVLYSLVFAGLLLPARLWAACTLFHDGWGTRKLRAAQRGMLASCLRALRSPTSLPFLRYRETARSSSLADSPRRPRRRSTSARSTCASARESS